MGNEQSGLQNLGQQMAGGPGAAAAIDPANPCARELAAASACDKERLRLTSEMKDCSARGEKCTKEFATCTKARTDCAASLANAEAALQTRTRMLFVLFLITLLAVAGLVWMGTHRR